MGNTREIALAEVQLECSLSYITVQNLQIHTEINQHSTMSIQIMVEEQVTKSQTESLENQPVCVKLTDGTILFGGICTMCRLNSAAKYQEVTIQASSYTYLADQEKKDKTFQNPAKTLNQVASELIKPYGGSVEISQDIAIPYTISQKQETDWEFLVRISNQNGYAVFVDSRDRSIRIQVGNRPFSTRELGEGTVLKQESKNFGDFLKTEANTKDDVASFQFEQKGFHTRNVSIVAGDMVDNCLTASTDLISAKGVLSNCVSLQNDTKVVLPYDIQTEEAFSSRILTGTVIDVTSEIIRVQFDVDGGQNVAEAVEIPYESVLSNSFFTMPDMNDKVFVYCDNQGEVICLGSKRSDTEDEHFQKPEEKAFGGLDNLIHFKENDLNLTATREEYSKENTENQIAILLEKENGVTVRAKNQIVISSKQEVVLAASRLALNEINNIKQELIEDYGQYYDAGKENYKKLGGYTESDLKQKTKDARWNNFKSDVANSFIEGGKSLIFYNWWHKEKPLEVADEMGQYETGTLSLYGYTMELRVGNSFVKLGNDIPGELYIYTKVFGWLGSDPIKGYPQKADELRDAWEIGMDILAAGLAIAGTVCLIVGTGGAAAVALMAVGGAIALSRGDYFGAVTSTIGAICGAVKYLGAFSKTIEAIKGLSVVQKILMFMEESKKIIAVCVLVYKSVQYAYNVSTSWQQMMKRIEQHDSISGKVAEAFLFILTTTDSTISLGSDARDGYKTISGKDGGGSSPHGGGDSDGGNSSNHGGGDSDGGNSSRHGGGDSDGTNTNEHTRTTGVGDPVDIVTGALQIIHSDLVVKDIHSDFAITRTYRSVYTNENRLLGSKWMLNIESALEFSQQGISVILPDCHMERFVKKEGKWQNRKEGKQKFCLTEDKEGYRLYDAVSRRTYTYNQTGRITAITDEKYSSVQFCYADNVLAQILLESGVTLTFSYQDGRLHTVQDNIGRTVKYQYKGDLLTSVTYANDGVVTYGYTEEGYLEKITDQNGKCYVTSSYDRKGRVVRQLMADGEEYIYLYNEAEKVNTFVTMSKESSVKYYYNRDKLVTKVLYEDDTYEEKKYDVNENLIYERDRNGNCIFRTFSPEGLLLSEEEPTGLKVTYKQDERGNLIEQEDNAGRKLTFAYDAHNNLIRKELTVDSKTKAATCYEYDSKGRLLSVEDANHHCRKYSYDTSFGMPSHIMGAEGEQVFYEYDKAGRKMSQNDGAGVTRYAYNHFDYITSETDALGNTTRYSYDRLCNLTNMIRPIGYQEKTNEGIHYEYDDMNHLVRTVDELGNVVAVEVDCSGNITKEINPNSYQESTGTGEGICYQYDKDDRRIKIIYPDGGIERIFYDANGNIIKKVQPMSYEEEKDDGPGYCYTYDGGNRLVEITNPKGIVEKRYVYDLCGNIVKIIDSKGYLTGDNDEERIGTIYTYNLAGAVTSKRVPVRQNQDGSYAYALTTYEYDKTGNLVEEKRYLDYQTLESMCGRIHRITRSYDKSNRLCKVSDSTGAARMYQYNQQGYLIREKTRINEDTYHVKNYRYLKNGNLESVLESADKKGSGKTLAQTRFLYDANGNLIRITTPLGNEIRREYDAANRMIKEIHQEKQGEIHNTFIYTYDKAGNLSGYSETDGRTVTYQYDLLNRQLTQTDERGAIHYKEYDRNGRLYKIITPNEYAKDGREAFGVQYLYDELDRVTNIFNRSRQNETRMVYNDAGEVICQHYAAGSRISFQYDFAGRRQQVCTAGNSSQSYEYDAMGNIVGILDGNRNKTEYELDEWGRILSVSKPDHTREQYAYDYAGNVIRTVDGNGNETNCQYNAINRLESRTDAQGFQESWLYDIEGRMCSYTDRNGSRILYQYNMYGDLKQRMDSNRTVQESYGYRQNGRLAYAIGGGMRYEYAYLPDGFLKEKKASGRTLISYTYDLNGNKTSQTDLTGKKTEYVYNDQDMLREVWDNGKLLASYAYEADGMVSSMRIGKDLATTYAYDTDRNLTGQKTVMGSQVLADFHYSYDGNGNMVSKQGLHGTETYRYDVLNQIVEADYPTCREQLFYDNAGNRTRRVTEAAEQLYAYDSNNRLTELKEIAVGHEKEAGSEGQPEVTVQKFTYDRQGNLLQDGNARYQYDAFGRMEQAETVTGRIQKNRYDAEGMRHEMEENGKLIQFLYSGEEVAAATKEGEGMTRYIRGYGLISSDSEQARTYYHYVSDEKGSITHLISSEEERVLNEYSYDVFGNRTVLKETVDNLFGYTGQQYDGITGQYYLRARYYNPVIGRFIQEDTYYGDGLNLYAYCCNNPVMYYDPTGYEHEVNHNRGGGDGADGPDNNRTWGDPDFADRYRDHRYEYDYYAKQEAKKQQGKDGTDGGSNNGNKSNSGKTGGESGNGDNKPKVSNDGTDSTNNKPKADVPDDRPSQGARRSKLQEVFDVADNYNLSDDTFNNHILKRHGPNSTYRNKSHFNANFDIKAGIDSTLKGNNSIVLPNTAGRGGYIFEQTFTSPIGTNSKGKPLYTLKVVIDESGNVITAFPKK